MSVPLPGEVGDTSSIGFVGYDWATAVPDMLAASAPAASTVTTPADFAIITSSVVVSVVLCRRKYSRRPLRSMTASRESELPGHHFTSSYGVFSPTGTP